MTDQRETSVDYIAGERYAFVYSSDRKYILLIKKLYQKSPESFGDIKEDKDGCVRAHILPEIVFKLKPKRNISDAQREACIQRIREVNAKRNLTKE